VVQEVRRIGLHAGMFIFFQRTLMDTHCATPVASSASAYINLSCP
jgi:hypothetical protein